MYQHRLRKYILIAVLIFILLTGCTTDNNAADTRETPDQEQNGMAIPEGVLDEDFTELLLNEEDVFDAFVVLADDGVFANLKINQDKSEEEVLEMVQRYADQLKEKYPDQKLSFTAHQNGSVIIDLEM
jgi:hypothetical protein